MTLVVSLSFLAAHAPLHGVEATGSGDPELKSRYPQQCGSTPEVRLQHQHRVSEKIAPQYPSPNDQDLDHIAILEDDGSLVVGGVTDTDAIHSRFFASHSNVYTYICIFAASTFPGDVAPEGGFAFEQNLSNNVQRIGLPLFNQGATLKSRLNMNDLGEYGEDPGEELPGFLNTFSGVDVLGQEAEHMVGAFVQSNNADILGRGEAHWSFFYETYGSVMEGNGWQDNGGGTSWTTIASGTGYSQLDNYLYGFLLPTDVTDPMYLISNPNPNLLANNGEAALPVQGVTVSSSGATTVSINNISSQMGGARVPDANSSPKTFKMAFILVIPNGTTVADHDMEKIDDFRIQWEEFFDVETNGVGTMDTELGSVPVTADFESHQIAADIGVTVQFDNDSFGSISGFLWDFGDGNTSTERHPTHTYVSQGAFDVTLTVNGVGGPVVVTKPGHVQVGPETVYFEDDFETDQGWTTDPADNATTGTWLRADPVGSFLSAQFGNDLISAIVQPEDDHTPAGTTCLVTGNANPSDNIGVNDIDGGRTTMRSPIIDLSTAQDPVLSFWFWYTNNAGASPGRDTFTVDLSDDGGSSWVTARTVHSAHHFWREHQVRISDFVGLTNNVRVRFRAADEGSGSLVEAAVDDVRIFDVDTAVDVSETESGLTRFALERSWPNPFASQTTIRFAVPSPGSEVALRVYSVDGRLVRTLLSGHVDPGVHTISWNGRNDAGLRVANGVYLSRLDTPRGSLTRKMFYVK
ncbi:MAG: PKD domain-containing protein [Candidatus Krumholzibacteriia bacterium]